MAPWIFPESFLKTLGRGVGRGWGPGELRWSLEMPLPGPGTGHLPQSLDPSQSLGDSACSQAAGLTATQNLRPEPWTDAPAGSAAATWRNAKTTSFPKVAACAPAPCAERSPSQGPYSWTPGPPEGTVAPSPGLAFVTGSQNRPLDTKARLAQDSLAPGPELRLLGPELTRASVGTAPQLRATRDSKWAALALSGRSQCPSCGTCFPGQLRCSGGGASPTGRSCLWALQPWRSQLSPSTACPGRPEGQTLGKGLLLPSPSLQRPRLTPQPCRPGHPEPCRVEGCRGRSHPPRPKGRVSKLLCHTERFAGLDRD